MKHIVSYLKALEALGSQTPEWTSLTMWSYSRVGAYKSKLWPYARSWTQSRVYATSNLLSLFYIQVVCSELVPLEKRLIAKCSGARQSGCIVSSVWNIFGPPPFYRYTWSPVLLNIYVSNKLECTALCMRFFTCALVNSCMQLPYWAHCFKYAHALFWYVN